MTFFSPPPRTNSALLGAALVAGLAAALASGAEPNRSAPLGDELSDTDLDFFETRVRPVLVRHCIGCHADRPGRGPAGGLLLDSLDGWRLGGDSGTAIVPGDVEASLLVHAVRRTNESLAMPPDAPLDARDVAALEEWVRRGAPDPRDGAPVVGIDLEQGREHWAFRAIADPAPPVVPLELPDAWREHPIDAFVGAQLVREQLAPAPRADRRTLARRLHLDLIGLPPTPERVAAFESDERPDAYALLVEELLASPHHGERWGRHWLDVVRYADSNGLDENTAMANAWQFRDYVVRAFNTDKSFDRLVMEQVAGDLLPEEDDAQLERDRLVGTGFWVLGAKMLAEQDEEKLALDIVDEQLDVMGRSFMGLTIGCARCHDHKFDPIGEEDYYALAGILRSTRTMESLSTVARWYERDIGSRDEIAARRAWDERHDELEEQLAVAAEERFEGEAREWRRGIGALLRDGAVARETGVFLEAESFARGNVGSDDDTYGSEAVTIVREVRSGMPQFAEYEFEVQAPGRYAFDVRYASAEPRGLTLSIDGVKLDGEVAHDATGAYDPSGQKWELGPIVELAAGPHVLRLERRGSWPHVDALALWPVRGDDERPSERDIGPFSAMFERRLVRNIAAALGSERHAYWLAPWSEMQRTGAAPLVEEDDEEDDELSPLVHDLLANVPAPRDLAELEARYAIMLESLARRAAEADDEDRYDDLSGADHELWELLHDEGGPFAFTDADGGAPIAPARAGPIAEFEDELRRHRELEPPQLARALAVEDAAVVDLPVHLRGSHLSLGEHPIPRGFPEVFAHLVDGHAVPREASGRLELAQWLVDPRHPLTARVMVNRVWQGHFGRGLVGTSSNFGLRGDAPTHPKLLDWLATRFVESGWSVKALHRLIVSSQTYQQASAVDVAVADRMALIDPDGRFLWRYPTRRLEAEAVRDSILFASGRLDDSLGGSLLVSQNHAYVTNDQSQSNEAYDTPRRTLYLPIVRNAMYEFLSTFDYADPSMSIDRRPSTTIASQALWLLHSPFVTEASHALAERVLVETSDAPSAQIDRLFQIVFARAPVSAEHEAATGFLEAHGDLAALAQVLLASSEFLHVP